MNKSSAPGKNPLQQSKKQATQSLTLSAIALVVCLCTLACCAFLFQHINKIHHGTQSNTDNLQQTINTLRNDITVNAKLNQKEIDQQQNSINTLKINLTDALNRLNHSENQKTLDQVSALVNQANLEITINHNTTKSTQLLNRALSELQSLDDSSLMYIETTLKDNIKALNLLHQPKISDTINTINSLNKRIQSLPDFPASYSTPTTAPEKQTTPSTWPQSINHLLLSLKDLITIRHQQAPILPLLSEQSFALLKQNITLKLTLAQWALLNQDQILFNQSLKDVDDFLSQHHISPQSTQDIHQVLVSLEGLNIKPDYPDLTATLHLINQHINQPTPTQLKSKPSSTAKLGNKKKKGGEKKAFNDKEKTEAK